MPEFDTSEYKLSDYEKYERALSNIKGLLLNHSRCRVRISKPDNIVQLVFDPFFAKEYEYKNNRGGGVYTSEEIAKQLEECKNEDISDEDAPITDEALDLLCKKFHISFYDDVDENEEKPKYYDHELYPNALSGGDVVYHLGEGLLDFFYFDIEKNISSLTLAFSLLSKNGKKLISEISGKPMPEEKPIQFHNEDEKIEYIDKQWTITNEFCRSFFYSSLFTAAFTPVFLDYNQKVFDRYMNYILLLQKEYQERIKFCFDPDFYPTVLGHLYPSERYSLYCTKYKDYPTTFSRNETFTLRRNFTEDEPMPYGCNQKLMKSRLSMNLDENSPEYKEFEEKYCKGSLADIILKVPSCISVQYECSTLAEMLELEFSKMMEANVKLRKCKRCGRYFIMKGNYDTNYCDRIDEGQTRTCQELAAQENYKAKAKENPALSIYSKYYKRYAARVRARQIKEPDFKKWKYQALTKRDECSDGEISTEEYIEWMENAFPNRKPKN